MVFFLPEKLNTKPRSLRRTTAKIRINFKFTPLPPVLYAF